MNESSSQADAQDHLSKKESEARVKLNLLNEIIEKLTMKLTLGALWINAEMKIRVRHYLDKLTKNHELKKKVFEVFKSTKCDKAEE